jgi:AraC-like DNA-binding protein
MVQPARPRDFSIRSQLVGLVLAFVRARGGDVERLRRSFALPESAETDPEVTMALASLQAFFEAAERELSDPFLGLHVAAVLPRGRWDVLHYSARSAPTFRDALSRLARYMALFNEHVIVSFEERSGEGVIAQRIPGRPLCLGRHGNEFFAAAVLTQARAVAAVNLVPERVFFAHAAPRDVSQLIQLFGTERIEFGAERNGFSMSAAALATPFSSHDPALLSLVEKYAERTLAERGGPEGSAGFLGQVRQCIRTMLREEEPSLAVVARALKVSSRTLQRRLADSGTTFQALVQNVREELARGYVGDNRRPLGEVAFLLGYAELGPFVRAFRRWTGLTPAAFRARSVAQALTEGKRT